MRVVLSLQTEEQYMFIHDALLEAVQCGQTEVPARAVPSTLQALETAVQDGLTGMDLEFKVSSGTASSGFEHRRQRCVFNQLFCRSASTRCRCRR